MVTDGDRLIRSLLVITLTGLGNLPYGFAVLYWVALIPVVITITLNGNLILTTAQDSYNYNKYFAVQPGSGSAHISQNTHPWIRSCHCTRKFLGYGGGDCIRVIL